MDLLDVDTQRIIVIGASAGGFEALKTIIRDLPPDINASIFIVWHMSPSIRGILPNVLSNINNIPVAHAYDNEPIKPNRIYVAQPDHHLLIEGNSLRVTRGPKENRFRPAIDPLFRSAAYRFGKRTVGIVLSGALDDGTAGLWRIKHEGGVAIVQDPDDAEVPSMPANALQNVEVDYCLPVSEMAKLINRLSAEVIVENMNTSGERTHDEIKIAGENGASGMQVFKMGELSPFACPDCHGVLSKIVEGNFDRFRCHTGHAFSTETLMAALTEKIEESLYNAMRGIEESIMLLNHIGDHLADINAPKLAALYFKKAKEAAHRAEIIRRAVISNEQTNKDNLLEEMEEPSIDLQ